MDEGCGSSVGTDTLVLTLVPEPAPGGAWIQVLGRITVHFPDQSDPSRLTGSAQRLLSVLVAAGADGATAERIADEIWGDEQPNPWRPALRMAVARLRKQLPAGWAIISDGGEYRIDCAGGWIDAWRLDEIASGQAEICEEDLAWMLAGHPFADVDLLEMVGASTQHLRMRQITVAERFCLQAPTETSTTTCTALTLLVRDHPFNDRLAIIVARALVTAGWRTEAVLMMTNFSEAYASEFGAVPPEVAEFLSSGGAETKSELDEESPLALRGAPELPKELRHLGDTPMLGRDDELDRLLNSRGSVVTGATGSGKSRLLAAIIVGDPRVETTYVVGDDRLDLPLGPFAVAMPSLRDEILATSRDESLIDRETGSVERSAATKAWRIALAHLEARATETSQRLVVDDAHLLDATSLGLLRLLIRSNTAADLTVIVAGRSDFDNPEWVDLMRDAARAGLEPIELKGLERSVLDDLVYRQFPHATREARHGLSADVYNASAGLPAVAGPLIAAADPGTLALPEHLPGASALARVTASVSDRAAEVVAAAAVLGNQFSIGSLMTLTGLDEAVIFDVLDELWSTGLIVETDDPDQVRFRHMLIQQAFLEGIPLFRRGQLHRRAAELTDEPHERADHQANASGLVPAETAAASLRDSAELYAARRQWRNAVRQLRRAAELPGDHLDVAALTLWAGALDRSGSDGSVQRRRAYQLAIEMRDWEAALDAALSGLPEAERPDGDPERIEMLEGIPVSGLAPGRSFDRAFNLSRAYGLLGDQEKVLQYADETLALARDADEAALSHVSRWLATRHVRARAHTVTEEVLHHGTLRTRVRLAQMNAINLHEAGDLLASRAEAARFDQLAGDLGDPLRIWQSQCFKAGALLDEGDFTGAEDLALRALQFADLHDLQQGAATYVGQLTHSHDLQGRLDELGERLEPFRTNLEVSILGRAVLVLCDESSGDPEVAQRLRAIVEDAHSRAGNLSLVALVTLGRHLRQYAPELIPRTRSILAQFGTNPIMAGFGGGSFGPTVRYVAQLEPDDVTRRELITSAIRAADEQGSLLWRVRARLDLAEMGSAEARDEATELAAGTQLQAVVEQSRARREGGDTSGPS